MLLFELDAPLFALKANAPAFEPLSQFPDYKSFARMAGGLLPAAALRRPCSVKSHEPAEYASCFVNVPCPNSERVRRDIAVVPAFSYQRPQVV